MHYSIRILIIGILTIFGSIGLGRFAIGLIIPEMGVELGFSNEQIGLIVSSSFFGYLVSTVVSSNVASRASSKKVVAISMSLVATGMVLTGSASLFLPIVIGQLLVGIGVGGSNVPTIGLVSRWFSEEYRGLISGLLTIGSGLGFALSGLLVPYLLQVFGAAGWRVSWFVLSLVVILITLAGFVILKNYPSDIGLAPFNNKRIKTIRESLTDDSAQQSLELKDIYRIRSLWNLGFIYLIFGFSYVLFTTFFAKYLVEDIGFSQVAAGRVWVVIGIASILSGFTWGKLSDSIGRKRILMLLYAIQSLSLFVLALTSNATIIVFAAIIYSLTLWGVPAVMAAICADYVGVVLAPAALGMITVFFGIGQMINPWISGRIIDSTHQYTLPFLLVGFICFFGVLLTAVTLKKFSGTPDLAKDMA